MIPSTRAQLFATSAYGEVCPYQGWDDDLHPGMLVAIVIYDYDAENDNNNDDDMGNSQKGNTSGGCRNGIVAAQVHLCMVDAGVHAGANHVAEKCMWESNEMIMRFSASSKIPLMMNHNVVGGGCDNDDDEDISSNEEAKKMPHEHVIEFLRIALGNVRIDDPVCWITALQISHSAKERVEHQMRPRGEVKDATYVIVQRLQSLLDGEKGDILNMKGFICTISVNHDSIATDDRRISISSPMNMTPVQIPIPLLSISLKCKRMKKKHSSIATASSLKILLQQCLKRLLIGNIIVSPESTSDDRTYLLSPTEESGKYAKGAVRFRSIISLQTPSMNYGEETHTYEVVDVVPNYKGVRGIRNKQPRIFLILPSTRITLLDDENPSLNKNKEGGKEQNIVDQEIRSIASRQTKEISVSTSGDVILETIQGIIHLSKFTQPSSLASNATNYADVPRAFLLTGPPGVGKTHSVRTSVQTANSNNNTMTTPCNCKLISLRGSEILDNETEATSELQKYFSEAIEFCNKGADHISIMFVDECDALLGNDTVGGALAYILDIMSSSSQSNNGDYAIDRGVVSGWKRIMFVAATNRVDAIPSYLRRPGRLDRELCISPPNKEQRLKILSSMLGTSTIESGSSMMSDITEKELAQIADLCVGYVAADLSSLVRRAAFLSMENTEESTNTNVALKGTKTGIITSDTLRSAMKDVGASALRDSNINAPPTTRWSDIAGDAGGAKTALRRAVEWPILKKKEFALLGLKSPRGILMHGPPGCAKTTLARAAAGAAGVAFLSLSPADVYASSYVGEAEAVVRRAFTLARSASPCILFFDEIDSIVASSSSNKSGMDRGANAEARVLSTFLNEMDGVDGSTDDGVLVLGATNRPSTLDSALLRPGRFDRVIYVPPPDQEGRRDIFKSQCEKWEKSGSSGSMDIDIDYLSRDELTGSMTGAEIVGACREAAMLAIREAMDGNNSEGKVTEVGGLKYAPVVTQRHLEDTLDGVKPLLSDALVLSEYTKFEDDHALR